MLPVLILTVSAFAEKPTPTNVYKNRIPDIVIPVAHTEVCFGGGSILVDLNAAGASTTGGNCQPGDIGWVMEQVASVPATWVQARATCMSRELRLLEPFEWEFAEQNTTALALTDMASLPAGCAPGVTSPSDCEWVGNEHVIGPDAEIYHWLGGNYGVELDTRPTISNVPTFAFRCGR